jgi:hypothetical protein
MKSNWLKALATLVAVVLSILNASHAWATSLPPGGSVTPSLVSGTGVSSGYTILANTGWESISTSDGTAKVREIVVKGDTNNPYGGLDFIYQMHNTSGNNSGNNLSALNAINFGSFQTDVIAANPHATSFSDGGNSFLKPGGSGYNPTGATRSNDGSQVSFNFGTSGNAKLTPGSKSDLLIVRTDASNYTTGSITFTDDGGGTSGSAGGFTASTPEPASVFLLAGCLAGLGAAGAWKRRRKAVAVVS